MTLGNLRYQHHNVLQVLVYHHKVTYNLTLRKVASKQKFGLFNCVCVCITGM